MNVEAHTARLDPQEVREAVGKHDLPALCEVLGQHLAESGKAPSPHTLRSYRTGLELYLTFLHEGRGHLADPPHLQEFVHWLEAHHVSPATARSRVVAVRHLLAALASAGALERAPSTNVVIRADPKATRTPAYTEAEVERLLTSSLPEERLILLLALEGGLTTGEIAALRREHLRLEAAPPHLVMRTPEGKEERVELTDPLLWELHRWLLATPGRAGAVTAGATQPYLDDKMRQLCQRAGVIPRGLRGLRVTAGARLYKATGSVHELRRFLRLSRRAQTALYTDAVKHLDDPTG